VHAAPLLAVAAEPVRWRILAGLSDEPRCVCAIQDDVDVSASLLSYHLKALREAGLVAATRRGKWIDYTLAPDAHDRLAAALPTAAG
jgi:ArsR family transcriptional regulator